MTSFACWACGSPRALRSRSPPDRPVRTGRSGSGLAPHHRLGIGQRSDRGRPARRLDEPAGRLDLWCHRSRREPHRAQALGIDLADRLGRGSPEATFHRSHVREHDQHRCPQPLGEQRRGQILVDDRLDPVQAAAGIGDDRDASSAGADDRHAGVQQEPDGRELDDLERFRGGDHPAEAGAVRGDRPSPLSGQAAGVGLGIDRADGLRRRPERRVAGRDEHLGQKRRDRAAGEPVSERLLDQIPDHALGLGSQHVERRRRPGRLGLQCEHPHLGAVAVRDHQPMVARDRREGLGDDLDVAPLTGHIGRLAPLEQGVAAERDDHRAVGRGGHGRPHPPVISA